jgi:hypothetical protein
MPEKDVVTPSISILIVPEQPSSSLLLGSVRRIAGPVLLVSSPTGLNGLTNEQLVSFLREAKALNADRRLILAIKDPRGRDLAQKNGWEVVQNLKLLRPIVKGQQNEAEAIRSFSPVSWRQDIRSRLQNIGILALPKVRIWSLLGVSVAVFLFVFFRLLPSSQIRIWPNQEGNSFTTNVYLRYSGSTLPVPLDRVRVLPLELLTVTIDRTLTFDQISKNFTGTNASMTVTIFNDSDEKYSLRRESRIVNQAGMRFRLREDVILDAHSKQDIRADADPIDQFGEVLGARGNVPAGVKWDFPGLTEKERKLVYGRNEKPATGGATSYVNLLTKDDVYGAPNHAGAKQRLEQELLMVAKQQVEEERVERNSVFGTNLVLLQRDELTKVVYKDFQLSDQFIGQNVSSIPVQGSIEYTVILYDEDALLTLLKDEVYKRVPPGKVVVESSLVKENMDLNVIPPWDDDFQWVKITADLTYSERYVISPITPNGARFGKYVRDNVAGKTATEAERILKNLPEVERVEISVWPPWSFTLPAIGGNIAIKEEQH